MLETPRLLPVNKTAPLMVLIDGLALIESHLEQDLVVNYCLTIR